MFKRRKKYIPFEDCAGRRFELRADLTMEDLVRMGLGDMRFVLREEPLPRGYIQSVEDEAADGEGYQDAAQIEDPFEQVSVEKGFKPAPVQKPVNADQHDYNSNEAHT